MTRKTRRNLIVAALMLLILLWFAAPVVVLLPFQMLFFLVAGWLTYPLRVWQQASVNWDGVISAVVVVVAAGVALHLLMNGFRRRQRALLNEPPSTAPTSSTNAATSADAHDPTLPPRPAWRLSYTLALITILGIGFASSLCAIGLFRHGKELMRQDAWGETSLGGIRGKGSWHSKQASNLGQLALSVRLDWQDRGGGSSGVFPTREHLHALRSDDYMRPYFSIVSWKIDNTPELWIPIEGIPVEGADDLPLIVSPFYDNDRILVATADASITIMTMDEWLDALEQWRPRFAELGIPWPTAFEVLGK